MKKIFIDAGHNYSNWGTGAVANGMREQDITFDVAFELGRLLTAAGLDVMLSRPTVQTNLGTSNNSSINARWQMSNAWAADFFISIHANAGGGTGAETLFFRGDSAGFAHTVQDVYSEEMGLRNRRVWQRDDVAVIRHATCPAILVELAFIDSPPANPDIEILRNRRPEMAAAVAKGVLAHLGVDPSAATAEGLSPKGAVPLARFNTLDELPTWARPAIQRLVDAGHLRGNNNDLTALDLPMDMVRIFVVHDMAGLYVESPKNKVL